MLEKGVTEETTTLKKYITILRISILLGVISLIFVVVFGHLSHLI